MSKKRKLSKHSVEARAHGSYLLDSPDRNALAPNTDLALLVGFHGYAETAAAHLESLQKIPNKRSLALCAVQALNLFYTKKGAVAANWMTSFERATAIQDNIAYINAVTAQLVQEYGPYEKTIYLGFSQGASMAFRQAAFGDNPCDAVIALSGDIPPELDTKVLAGIPCVLFARGSDDHIYTSEQMKLDTDRLKKAGCPVETFIFSGGHAWTDEFCIYAGDFIRKLSLQKSKKK